MIQVGSRRASWRIISSVQQKEQMKGNEANAQEADLYKKEIEAELNKICQEIINLLQDNLIKPLKEQEGGDDSECAELKKNFLKKIFG